MDPGTHVSSRLRPRRATIKPSSSPSGNLVRTQSTLTGSLSKCSSWAVPRAKTTAADQSNGHDDAKKKHNGDAKTAFEDARPKKRARTIASSRVADLPGPAADEKSEARTPKTAKASKAAPPPEPLPFLSEDEILLCTTTQLPPLSFDVEEAKRHLVAADARFGPLLERVKLRVFEEVALKHDEEGHGNAKHESKGKELNLFKTLVSSVMGQQVSWMAARSILYKFVRLWFEELPATPDFDALPRDALPFPTPTQVCAATEECLRSAGLSGAKARYVRDIATRLCDGRLDVRTLVGLSQPDASGERSLEGSEEEVINELVQIKGVGRWTAEMFCLFALRYPNVLATGDLGIQRGVVLLWASGAEGPAVKKGNPAEESAEGEPARKKASEALKIEKAVEEAERDVDASIESGNASKSDADEASPVEPSPGRATAPPPIPSAAKLTPAQLTARKNGQKVKGGKYLTPEEMTALCAPWEPYRSLASIVMWSLVGS